MVEIKEVYTKRQITLKRQKFDTLEPAQAYEVIIEKQKKNEDGSNGEIVEISFSIRTQENTELLQNLDREHIQEYDKFLRQTIQSLTIPERLQFLCLVMIAY